MDIFAYDGSFEGLLTAIFEVHEYKSVDADIQKSNDANSSLFGNHREVITDQIKSGRVLKKLKDKLSNKAIREMYSCFLSEGKDIENVILRYVQYIITSARSVENNYAHPDVLLLQQTNRKVHREKHRMEAFIRFQLTKDELYYAVIQPDYNVLPLISNHFEKRYADQRWLIYDSFRKYGLYYDLNKVEEVFIDFDAVGNNSDSIKSIYEDHETIYQDLWRQYFTSVNIPARKNMKLHIQHMPKRYWWALTEKQLGRDYNT